MVIDFPGKAPGKMQGKMPGEMTGQNDGGGQTNRLTTVVALPCCVFGVVVHYSGTLPDRTNLSVWATRPFKTGYSAILMAGKGVG